MPDETSASPEEPVRSGRRGAAGSPALRRGGRLAILVALVVAGVLVGGTVAWAIGGGDGDEGTGEAPGPHQHAGGSDDESGNAPAHGRARPRRDHDHPARAPYAERYAAATADQQAAADALLADVEATIAAYTDVDAALAAGYRRPRHPHGRIEHYVDPTVARDGQVLDPTHPNGLVYYTGGDGDPVLLGAFFVAPPGTPAPMPAGELVVWHSHDPSCTAFFASEADPCSDSRRMLHVWTADHVELVTRRSGRPLEVRISDPFGAPFAASVTPVA